MLVEWLTLTAEVISRLLFLPVLAVPQAQVGQLGVEAGTDTLLEAVLLEIVLSPWLEGRGLCLGAFLRMGRQVGAVVPVNTGLF